MNEQKRTIENASLIKLIQRKFIKGSKPVVNFYLISFYYFLQFLENKDLTNKTFVREGSLVVTNKGKQKTRYFFLFEDCILLCEEKKNSPSLTTSLRDSSKNNKDKIGYIVKGIYNLDKLQFSNEIGTQLFKIVDEKNILEISATDVKDREAWYTALLSVMDTFLFGKHPSKEELEFKQLAKVDKEFQRKKTFNRLKRATFT